MKKLINPRRILALLLVFLLTLPMNIGVFAEQDEPSIQLSTDTRYVKAGGKFTVSAAFGNPVQSNAVTLRYSFDGEKFEYADFAFADGSVIDTRQDEGAFRVTLMIPNYNAENLGELTLRVKDGAQLLRETQRVDLAVEYVLQDGEDDKVIRTEESFVSFTTLNGSGPEVEGDTNGDGFVDVIDLSNIVDWFGENEDAGLWPDLYIWFDFNGDKEIDIYDIAYVARLIGSGQWPVSRAALKLLIDKAEALGETDYTPESWAGLAAALADAKEVYENADAAQGEINAAAAALQDAIDALVPLEPDTVDKSALESLIAEAEALEEADYTPESWEVLQEALEAAQAVAADDGAAQDEVDEAAGALEAAIEGLTEKDPDTDIIPVTSIKINSIATTEIRKGKTMQLSVILTPANANSGAEITWSTSNAAVVTVNAQTGLITGVKAGGNARITATSSNGKTHVITVAVAS